MVGVFVSNKRVLNLGNSYKMRLFLIIVFSLLLSPLFAQDHINIDSFFIDASKEMIYSSVVEVPGVSKAELLKRTKNWGGKTFVSAKNVVVSESEDQTVFRYIDNSFFVKSLGMSVSYPWYIRLIVEVKEGKLRAQYFDDGVSNGQIHFKSYFKEDDGKILAKKVCVPGLTAVKNSISSTQLSLSEFVKKGGDQW
jgi:hypothetical protein